MLHDLSPSKRIDHAIVTTLPKTEHLMYCLSPVQMSVQGVWDTETYAASIAPA